MSLYPGQRYINSADVCGVVWCGVVWCGVVWCGVVWCGVVWCGVVWCGVVWCGVVWCGVVWYMHACVHVCVHTHTSLSCFKKITHIRIPQPNIVPTNFCSFGIKKL